MSSYSVQQQWTISQSDCEVRWKVYFKWQPVMTSSVVGLRRSSKTLPKAKVAPEKVMVTIWWSVRIWSTTPFWIPAKPLHLRSTLSKSGGSTENCNTCSWHWLAEWAQFSSTALVIHRTTNTSEVEWIGLWSFTSSTIFTWLLANWLPLLQASRQLFVGKTLPQPAGGRRCFPRVPWIPKHRFLCYRNKQTYFSLAKMCWL